MSKKKKKITIEHGDVFLYFSNDCFIHTINQWRQFLGGYNWVTFNLILIEIEKDGMFTGWEFQIIILGFGLRFRWNDKTGKGYKEIMKRGKECESQAKGKEKNEKR